MPTKANGTVTATYGYDRTNLDKVKEISRLTKRPIKDVIDKALTDLIKGFEKKNGEIKITKGPAIEL